VDHVVIPLDNTHAELVKALADGLAAAATAATLKGYSCRRT
jgi:hypothetical protein